MTVLDHEPVLDKETIVLVKGLRGDTRDQWDIAFLRGEYNRYVVPRAIYDYQSFIDGVPRDAVLLEDFK